MAERTRALIERAEAILLDMESAGGMPRAIDKGLPMQGIETAAAEKQSRIDAGIDRIVGLNLFAGRAPENMEVLKVEHEAVLKGQLERLDALRAHRDADAASKALDALESAARETATCWLRLWRRPGCGARWAKCRTRWNACLAAMFQLFGRFEVFSGNSSESGKNSGWPCRKPNVLPTWKGDSPAFSSPRWARTDTTVAPR